MTREIAAPGPLLRMLEGRAAMEAGQLLLQLPLLRARCPSGSGPVMVLPGFLADDDATWLLRRFIDSLGYDAHPWGLGRNLRSMLSFLKPLEARIESLVHAAGRPLQLVGWSRGGALAREIARDRPDLVQRVITIGTPVRGGVHASSIGPLVMRQTNLSAEQIAAIQHERARNPITVPIIAIYSKTDGVVAWQACIDESSPNVVHHEIDASHVGMVTNARVFRRVADALADSTEAHRS